MAFLHKFLYRIPIKSMKNMFLQKLLTGKTIRRSYSLQIWAKFRKKCLHWDTKKWTFIKRQIFFFFLFENTNFIYVFWPKHVCLGRNHQFLLIKNIEVTLNTMIYYICWIYIKFLQRTWDSWLLSCWSNISFVNTVLEIIRICPANIIT